MCLQFYVQVHNVQCQKIMMIDVIPYLLLLIINKRQSV